MGETSSSSTSGIVRIHAGAEQKIRAVGLRMAVDGDGDGAVTFGNPTDTNALFWVNNDCDIEKHNENMWQEDDANPDKTAHKDCSDNHIGNKVTPGAGFCLRDLEDFMRLHVRLDGSLDGLAGLLWKLSFESVEGGAPAVNLFEAVDGTDGFHSVRTNAVLQAQETKAAFADAELGESDFWPAFTNGLAPFVLEGARAGKGCMTAKLYWHGAEVGRASVAFDIRPCTDFYSVWQADVSGSQWNAAVDSSAVNVQSATVEPLADDAFLFVHGWNMAPWEKRRWTETAFKRLWWQGYRGKCVLFDWPTLYDFGAGSTRLSQWWDTITDTRNFDNSEFIAWQSSTALADLMQTLNTGNTRLAVMAHSMGNVVMGEALKKYTGPQIHAYVAAQAAISAQCYDNTKAASQAASFLGGTAGPATPDILGHFSSGNNATGPYLDGVLNKVSKRYNYFNEDDYALNKWLINNYTKPDNVTPYYFNYNGRLNEYTEPTDVFRRSTQNGVLSVLSVTNEIQRYQIFAYCAESRSQALGQITSSLNGFESAKLVNLQTAFGYNGHHYSHSREFRSNIVDENAFWGSIMTHCDFQRPATGGQP